MTVDNIQPCPKLCLLMPLACVGARTDSTTRLHDYNVRRGQFAPTRIGIVQDVVFVLRFVPRALHFSVSSLDFLKELLIYS